MADETETPLNNVIRFDDERIKEHLDRAVCGTVGETLNALLDAYIVSRFIPGRDSKADISTFR